MTSSLENVRDQVGVALPDHALRAIGLQVGMPVDVTVEGQSIVIRVHEPSLDELLAQIDGPPPPMEWEGVPPKGSDVW